MTSLHALAFPPVIRGLRNLSAILKKAQSSGIDANALLTSRIHPTMFPFPNQIVFATNVVVRMATELNSSLPPSPLPPLEENPTFDTLIARISQTIDYLEAIAPEDVNGREDEVVKLRIDRRKTVGDVVYLEYGAVEFVQVHVHPYFWFHVTTAYDLLRAGGVELGKVDFLNASGLKEWEIRQE